MGMESGNGPRSGPLNRTRLAPQQSHGAPSDPPNDLIMAADRGQSQSVENARRYQMLIPNSRLVILRSDGYHIAASNAAECVTNVLAFIKEASRRA